MKKILIIEDEPLVIDDLEEILTELGYEVVGTAESFEEVKDFMDQGVRFDIVLQDVQIVGDYDGIETAAFIHKNTSAQIVFLTSFSDDVTIKRIRSAQPAGYIVKPYKKEDLKTTLALIQEPSMSSTVEENSSSVLIKDGMEYIKINLDEIFYLEAADNYCKVHTTKRKFLLSLTLKATLDKLPGGNILRCHRSFAINTNKIDRVGATYVIIGDQEVPFNEGFKRKIEDRFSKL